MRAPNLHTPRSLLRLNPSHMSIKPAQISPTLVSESFSSLHQTCTNLAHSCVWILLIHASNLHKPLPLLLLNSSHSSIKPAQTSPTPMSESFSNKHQTCTKLAHSSVWILLIHASNLHKPLPLLLLNSSHSSIKPAQTSPTPTSEYFSNKHQTCTKLTQTCVWILLIQASKLQNSHHSCVWILLMCASNLHKPHPLLRLNPSHRRIKAAQTSSTSASESFSCLHQTCTNLTHSWFWILLTQASNLHKPHPPCVWIFLIQASDLHKPHPVLHLNPSHTCIKPAHTSPTPASESFSCLHQTCTNLTHSCFWILLIQASNLHKPHPLLRLNPSHTSIKTAQTSTTLASESFSNKHQNCTNLTHSCVWILLMRAPNLHTPRSLLRLNPSHMSIKPAQISANLASESFSCLHQTCANLTHSCVWIFLMLASNLQKSHPLLLLNSSHTSIKPVQTSPTPASGLFSNQHQTCTNLTQSCLWILLIQASKLHKPHPIVLWILLIQASNLHKSQPHLHLNPSHACIKPAQTSPTPASETFSYTHQTCTNLTNSCVLILLIQASNLHKPHPILLLNPSHRKHQTCTNLTHSCIRILLMLESNLHKPHLLLGQNPSHAWIKPAQTSPTPASESFSYTHQTRPNLTNSCVWILLIQASNLHKPPPLLRLNPSHTLIKPAQTPPTPASESFSCLHQTCTNLSISCVWIPLIQASNCTNLTQSCLWILLIQASKLHKPHPIVLWILLIQASNLHKSQPHLLLNPSHACIKPAQTSPTPASETFSYTHQTCTNLTNSCVLILLIQASNLHKPHRILLLNPSHRKHQTCTNLTHSCIRILLMLESNLHKPHLILGQNPSHAWIKPAQTSPTPASESFSYTHQTRPNLTNSCVWILLIQASNLHKPPPLLRLNPSHTLIKPAQTPPTPASESFSCLHQTCTNLSISCVWIPLIQASNLHKPHPILRLNPSHTSIKPAQTSPTLASESFSCLNQTCTNLTYSWVRILLMLESNLHKPHPLLRLNPSHACIKPAQTSPTPAPDSFSYTHQTRPNLTSSCVWILLIQASNLHKPPPLLRLNPSHACIKPAQTSPTPASESFSYTHQTRPNLTNSCVWILLIQASNLHKPPPLVRLNPSHTRIKPAQTSPTPASESFF